MHEIPILGRLFELRKFLMQSGVAILLHTCSLFFRDSYGSQGPPKADSQRITMGTK